MSKNNKASNYNEKMLTRLRIQFIVLSMAVVIIMQGFIVYTSVRNTYNKMVAKSDHLVSSIYINILDKKPIKADARYFYITFGKDNRPRTINIDNISDISEDEAYRRMQQTSMKRGIALSEVAQKVVKEIMARKNK